MNASSMRKLLVASVGALAVAACGGDSDSSGVQSGVDTSKPANTVAPSDAQKVCSAIASYAASQLNSMLIRRAGCLAATGIRASAGTAPTVAECNASVEQCVGQQSTSTSSTAATGTPVACTGTAVPPNCTATVGEIQACATASIDATRDYFNGLTCDLWGLPPAEAQARLRTTRPTPAECAAVQQKCPALLVTQPAN